MAMALKMQTSRKIKSQSSHIGRRRERQSSTSAERPSSLSASGSRMAPMAVNCLSMRAAMPSSQSVIMAPMKTARAAPRLPERSEEHTSELQSHLNLVCRLLLEKKKKKKKKKKQKKKKKKKKKKK